MYRGTECTIRSARAESLVKTLCIAELRILKTLMGLHFFIPSVIMFMYCTREEWMNLHRRGGGGGVDIC